MRRREAGCKAGGIKSTGRAIEPRNMYSRWEADALQTAEGSIPVHLMTVVAGQGRGLRTGHVYTGLVRELERSVTFLGKKAALGSRVKILLVILGFAALS